MKTKTLPVSLFEFLTDLRKRGIPDKDYEKYIGNYLEFSAREKRIPLHGMFELTPFCNLDCKMCYIHLSQSQYDAKRLLSIEAWKKIITEAHNTGMRKASLTGGECLTYPGFDELYLFLLGLGVPTSILSNGVLLNSERIRFLQHNPPRGIQVSIYGSNDKAYEKVTGKQMFQTVKRNIFMARDAGLHITLSITPSRFMQDDLDYIIEMVEEWQFPYYINSFISTPRISTGRENEDMSIDYYIKLFKRKNELKQLKGLPEIDPSELPEESHSESVKYGLSCGAGRSLFVIKYDGSMCPCVGLSEVEIYPLEEGFQTAWKKINTYVENYRLPLECEGCFYRSSCPNCVVMHKEAPIKGHCDPRVCARTKKLISAGITRFPR